MTEVETELLRVQTITRDRCLVTGLNLALASDPVEVGKGLFIDRGSVGGREFLKAARDASMIDRLKQFIWSDLELRAMHIQSYCQLKADGGSLDMNCLDDQVSKLTSDVEENYRKLNVLTKRYEIELDEKFKEFVKSLLKVRIQ